MNHLMELFLRRPLLTNVFMSALILTGMISVLNMEREFFPNAELDLVFVNTVYPGASPKEVEQNVTRHIEEELKTVSGMKRYTSYSMDSISAITIEIDSEVPSSSDVIDDIRRAVARVGKLPDGVDGLPVVDELDAGDIPVMEIGVSGDVDYGLLREMAETVEKQIEDIKGVKQVDKIGFLDREIRVDVEPDKLFDNYLSIHEIMQAIENRSVRVQGGTIETTDSIKHIMTLSQFDTAKDIGKVIVRSNYSGKTIRVDNIANVRESFEKESIRNRVKRKNGISLIVMKKAGHDQLIMTDKIKVILETTNAHYGKKYEGKIKIEPVYSTSYFLKNRLKTIYSNAIIGFILVLVTLFIFLNFKVAFWTATGIPVAVFIGFSIMKSIGLSINIITMGALIMVMGMLVDDAIIVGENIYRHRLNGMTPLDAARKGLKEVFWPVLCTIITTLVAFSPLFGIRGMIGKFIWVLPAVISVTLIGSLIDCLFILPCHVCHSKFSNEKSSKKETIINNLKKIYEKVLIRALKYRYLVVLMFIFAFICSTVFYMKQVGFRMFPEEVAELFYIKIETKNGDSLDRTEKLITQIEDSIWKISGSDLVSVVSRIGVQSEWGTLGQGVSFPHQAIIFAFLSPANKRDRTAREVMEAVRKDVGMPKGFEQIRYILDSGGPPAGNPIDVNIRCSNDDKRTEYAEKVYSFIKKIPGATAVVRSDTDYSEQISLEIDYDKVARFGLNVSNIASSVRFAFNGIKATEIIRNNNVIEVRLGFPKKYRMDTKKLLELGIKNSQGRLVKIKRFAVLGKRIENSLVYHYDGESTVKINSELDQSITTSNEAMVKIENEFKKMFDSDPEASIRFTGEGNTAGESINDLLRSMFIAACLIYIVLLMLFNSLTQPFLIMLAIPFGFIGVVVTLFCHGISMTFMSAVGTIGLSGVVVNDSLVMVSFINDMRKKTDSGNLIMNIVEAAKIRLRPIILTTVTTVCGLVPTAYGLGGSDVFIQRLVLPMSWGLLFATVLTLILIPCLYHIDDDVRSLFKRKICKN